MEKIISTLKREAIFFIALGLAFISCLFVPISAEYLNYIDYKTIVCLFCMMAVICALKNTGLLQVTAKSLVFRLKNTRILIFALVFITFVASVFIANDMALITFLPLTIIALEISGKEKYAIITIVLQNIAANLGGMVTPFGNPQNLYLYSFFNIPNGEFFTIMLPPFLTSIVVLFFFCAFMKKEKIKLEQQELITLNYKKIAMYALLFLFAVLIVFNIINYMVGLFVVILVLLVLDKQAIFDVDYYLLGTFVCFFIFSSNLSRIGFVNQFITSIILGNELLVGLVSCQVISNVPTAILMSRFTINYQPLLLAVNIGGLGTLVASLASLISFKTYVKRYGNAKKYLIVFSVVNFSIMGILVLQYLIK